MATEELEVTRVEVMPPPTPETELAVVALQPAQLVALALEQKADPETLERLLALQERWQAGQARMAYVAAMAAFKAEVPSILPKDTKVDFSTSKGRTRYSFASLGSIIGRITEALARNGLSLSWQTDQGEGTRISVTCHVTHVEGHRESVTLVGPPDDWGGKNCFQMIGSTVSYLERYTLLAALGLSTSDQHDADMPSARPVAPPRPANPGPDHKAAVRALWEQFGMDDKAIGERLIAIAKDKGLPHKKGALASWGPREWQVVYEVESARLMPPDDALADEEPETPVTEEEVRDAVAETKATMFPEEETDGK